MKKHYFFIIYLHSFFALAQAPGIDWQKTLGGNSADSPYSISPTADGGFIIGGASRSGLSGDKEEDCHGNSGTSDNWIIKTDGNGSIEWQKSIGGEHAENFTQIIQTADGGYILGCSSSSDASGDKTEDSYGYYDYWVVKLDAQGNVIWDKTLGGDDYDFFESIIQTPDGGYLVGGTSSSNLSGNKTENSIGNILNQNNYHVDDYWIIKLDAFGTIEWQNTLGGNDYESLGELINTPDGGYLVAGGSGSGISGDKTEAARGDLYDYWILKLNSTGNIVWQRTLGGNLSDRCYAVVNTDDGGYLVGGYSASNISGEKTENGYSDGGSDFWVLKLDANGNIIWQKTIGGTGAEIIFKIIQDNNNFLLVGYSDSNISFDKTENSRGEADFWMVKITNTGAILWDKTVGGAQGESAKGGCYVAADNSFVVCGSTLSSNTGDKTEVSRGLNDYWIVKLAPDGLSTPAVALSSVAIYPNPTTKTLHIDAPFNQNFSIKLYNAIGQLTYVNQDINTSIALDIDGPKGVYFVTLCAANGVTRVFKVVKQ